MEAFKLSTYWAGSISGVGNVSLHIMYPHRNRLLEVVPKHFVSLPYYLSNSQSHHEIKGKYFIVYNEGLEHPHDNIQIRLKIQASDSPKAHVTDLDLVGLKKGQLVVAEVLNGRVTDIKSSLLRKSEAWSALRDVGIPIERVAVYVVVRVPNLFMRDYLDEILNVLKEKGFSGKFWLTDALTDAFHSRHREFTF